MAYEHNEIVCRYPVARTDADLEHFNTLVSRLDGWIAVILHTEAELDIYKERELRIEGLNLKLTGVTNAEGIFRFGPVQSGEYTLIVGDGQFVIPTVAAEDSDPYPVDAPNFVLPEVRDAWEEPTQEEIDLQNEVEDDDNEV